MTIPAWVAGTGNTTTTDPGVIATMVAAFNADWSDNSVHMDNPSPLIISPGAESTLVNLIQGAKQTLYIGGTGNGEAGA